MTVQAYGPRMRFEVLGPLEVSAGAERIGLGGPKQRSVLASLLVRPNQVVPADDLIDQLWGEDPPDTARKTLQSYVTHLRRALGPDRIEWRAPGYVLHLDPQELDAARFESLVQEAKATNQHPDRSAALYRRALELWRGPSFAGLAGDGTLAAETHRLEELRSEALEGRIAADLDAGRHGELIPELTALTNEQPLRERLWAQLMVALYRSGRQADASAAYHRAREVLAEELGLDPSEELRGLHDRILRNDPVLEAPHERLRGYELVEEIGEGGFGVVYRAWQPQLAREVAIKAIRPALANDPEFIRRFEAEAQLVARLEHANIVPLYDYWREPGAAYLVLRWIRGGSLHEMARRSPLDLETAVRLEEQVASALSFAHRLGIVHSDLKPANVLLDEEGNAYLSDFGIAADLGGLRTEEHEARLSPAYLSPEQIRGEPATPATDIYCLGLLLFQVLGGGHPFSGTAPMLLMQKQLHEPLPPVSARRPDLREPIDDVIARATAKDPAARFADVAAFDLAFREALQPDQTKIALGAEVELANPYKGLRPFDEADARDFFGRDALVDRLVARLAETAEGNRFLGVVGPSGSGKSSAVRAGLVPALRAGAIPRSDGWFVVEMMPGAHPFEELEAALLRIATDPPPTLVDQLQRDHGLPDAVDRLLPPDGSELLLVIDQLEELFTHVDDEEARARFLACLASAAKDPSSRVRVLVTLRADYFDRPLAYPGFGQLLGSRTETATPLTPAELELAIAAPAQRIGVAVEPELLAEIVADSAGRPGTLPLLQYALTELFERREDGALTLARYQEVGGVGGALAGRAERLYDATGEDGGREATRQLFLRLVNVDEGIEDVRRRVRRFELDSLDGDRAAMTAAIDAFTRHRILISDRDPVTREPTVEVAHEALLRSWPRLRGWIDGSREDLRNYRRLATEVAQWEDAGRDASFLLRGTRLERFEGWAAGSGFALNLAEREYLEASLREREAERAAEEAQRRRERFLEERSVRRLRGLVAVLTSAALVAASLTFIAKRQSDRAGREARIATARELAAAAVANLDVDTQRSLLLALRAVQSTREADGTVLPDAEEALHWAVQADRLLVTVAGNGEVDANPDGSRVLAEVEMGNASVYDTATGERLLTVQSGGELGDLDYSPDGRLFATSNFNGDGYVRVRDAATGDKVKQLSIDSGEPICCDLEFSPDRRFLATQAFDESTYLWDVKTWKQANHFHASGGLAFSPDGKRILIGPEVYETRGGHDVLTLSGYPDEPTDVSWSRDERMIAIPAGDRVIVWNARTGGRMFTIFPPLGGDFTQVDFGRRSNVLATGMGDGTAIVWELSPEGAKEAFTVAGHGAAIRDMVFGPDGRTLVTGGADGTARIWNVAPDGEREWLTVHGGTGVAYSPDGRLLATGSAEGDVNLYNANSGRRMRTLQGHTGWVNAVEFSADGSRLASAANDGTVRIWDPASGVEMVTLDDHGSVTDVAFSTDGTLVATTNYGEGGRIRVWDAATGELVRTLKNWQGAPAAGFFSVQFSPDGTRLAGADQQDTYVWRVDDGRILARLQQPEYVLRLAFSPDGRRLATSAYDGSIRLWDVRTHRELRSVPANTVAQGLAFSLDGSHLATVHRDGTLRLWDAQTLRQILLLDAHVAALGGPVDKIAFSPDGSRLTAASGEGVVRVYVLPIEELLSLARDRVARDFTEQECQQYLHVQTCSDLW
jgi:WD40 repeat protein/DNA-binding SARP family transcriptional activator